MAVSENGANPELPQNPPKSGKKKNKGSLGCEPLMKFETYQNDPFDGDFHAHHIGKMQ
jgi:hypothetical protein